MSLQIARRHFDVTEYYRMAEAGILTDEDRVELIDGEIIEMNPIGSRHSGCAVKLNALFSERLGRTAVVGVQNPLRLHDMAEPLPDVALLKPRADFYSQSHPAAADVPLVVEVAESSLAYDRHVKVPMYARAGVPEVWAVNLLEHQVEIYSQPREGAYANKQTAARGETFTSSQLPALALGAADVLG